MISHWIHELLRNEINDIGLSSFFEAWIVSLKSPKLDLERLDKQSNVLMIHSFDSNQSAKGTLQCYRVGEIYI